jgi:hypothetical protein
MKLTVIFFIFTFGLNNEFVKILISVYKEDM